LTLHLTSGVTAASNFPEGGMRYGQEEKTCLDKGGRKQLKVDGQKENVGWPDREETQA
jgi:hypothetical protein